MVFLLLSHERSVHLKLNRARMTSCQWENKKSKPTSGRVGARRPRYNTKRSNDISDYYYYLFATLSRLSGSVFFTPKRKKKKKKNCVQCTVADCSTAYTAIRRNDDLTTYGIICIVKLNWGYRPLIRALGKPFKSMLLSRAIRGTPVREFFTASCYIRVYNIVDQ
jgi:hypothetical protein